MLLFDHFLGPNNVGNMDSEAETKLTSTLYNSEKKCFTWETYVRIHTEQHSVLNGLKDYGYAGIDESSKVLNLLKGIKTTELDVCNTQVMASPSLHDDFAATVEPYSTLINQMKAENPQLNVSEFSFAPGKVGKNSYGKRHSTGISNVSNAAVDDRFFEKHEYNALTPDQKITLRLNHLNHGHVVKIHTGAGKNNGNNNGKGATIKWLTRSIAALSTKMDKFSLPDDDEDESSDEEEGTSNRSDAALTRQRKKKKCGNIWKANLSAVTMRLGSVGRVEEVNRSDLDSHADCCVCGKEVLVFNAFDREVTVAAWDPEGETQSLGVASAAMGYTIP
jgi:hypothetical protein